MEHTVETFPAYPLPATWYAGLVDWCVLETDEASHVTRIMTVYPWVFAVCYVTVCEMLRNG